jgi:hypothetical protein
MSNLYTLVAGQQTEGTWVHTGRLTVSRKLSNGVLVSVTLPDDWSTFTPTIPDGSITSAKIADGTIQSIDIANGAVTAAKLGSDVHPTAAEFNALVARVTALETKTANLPNSLEDLIYAG